MCGIAGLYFAGGKEAVNRDMLNHMNDCLIHRGPDDGGLFVKGHVGLAMRRLAIIDLSTGHQPMASDDGKIQIVFNGEIYNFKEIRGRLEADGVCFRTNSDTEAILRLYERKGVDCLSDLRGMFAFAIWDERADRIFIARDRIGKKPLVYAWDGARFAWASELRALTHLPWVSKEIDAEAVDSYLGLQYIPSPSTVFRSVKKLPPAHYLLLEKGHLRVERYWSLPLNGAPWRGTEEEAARIIREKLEEAVRIRMISDVPLGAFLSGGLDSSLVVGLMSRMSSTPVKTFSIGFEEEKFSELGYAKQVAQAFRTDHTEFVVKAQMADVLPKIAWHYGEPFGDSSALPMYYLSRETRRHVTVALNGDGGDESFAGYRRYVAMKLMDRIDFLPSSVRRALAPLGEILPRKGKRFFRDILPAPAGERYFQTLGYFSESEKGELYSPDFMRSVAPLSRAVNYLNGFFNAGQDLDFVNRLLYADIASYLPECLMVKADIATMAHSLEGRSPFLDHELMEFVFALPGDWKLKGAAGTKWILRKAFQGFLPTEIEQRSKMGFGIPLDDWFRSGLRDFWRAHVLSDQAIGRGYFQKQTLEKIFNEHQTGKRDHGYRMWVLLMLEMWHEAVLPQGGVRV